MEDCYNQEEQLAWAMEGRPSRLLSKSRNFLTGKCSGVKDSSGCSVLTPDPEMNKVASQMLIEELTPKAVDTENADVGKEISKVVDNWKTLEVDVRIESDCHVVKNKLCSLINDESHHSKWKEFRNLAKEGISNECSRLLKKMETQMKNLIYWMMPWMEWQVKMLLTL